MRGLDLTNDTYGDWLVLYQAPSRRTASRLHKYWVCKCSCGIVSEVNQGNLRSGASTCCMGCINKLAPYGKTHKFYWVVRNILRRCYDKGHSGYPYYGEKGICVYDAWISNAMSMVEYLEVLWKKQFGTLDFTLYGTGSCQYTVDRVGNTKGYVPGNLRFATKAEQNLNRAITLKN